MSEYNNQLGLPNISEDDFVNLPELWNPSKDTIANAIADFDWLCSQPGNKVTTTLTTQDGYDTWVDVVTRGEEELARCVDVQSAGEGGRDVWTKTITIAGREPVTIVDKETENGWESVVS